MQPTSGFLSKISWATFLGASIFSLGLILLFLKTWFLEFVTASLLVLKPHSSLHDVWQKMPMPIPTDIYLFNWTNPEDFHNFTIKPKFEQVGPYRYMQNMEKVNVVWNDNNTVTYNQVRSWYYDESSKNRNVSDNVTTLNAITLSTAHYIRNWNYFVKKAASALIASMAPHVHITRTVNQLLFEGYDDFIIDLANYLPFLASEIPRFQKFGWFRIRNASETFDGVFNIGNGMDGDFDVHNWNYQNMTPYFNGSCAKVHGSGTELYSWKRSKDHIGVFVSDICRYLKLDFEEEVVVNGILGHKYSVGNSVLDNGTLVPGNECYCAGKCIPSGMVNVSSCRYGLPTFVSLPNFYGADSVYLDAVEGLRPEKAKHETYIILEPKTSIPLKAAGRLQLNILVHPIEGISTYQNVPEIFFPLLWAQLEINLPPQQMIMLKIYLHLPYVITGTALVLMTMGLYFVLFVAFRSSILSWCKKFYIQRECLPLKPEEVPLQLIIKMSDYKFVKPNNRRA